jgi:hypothetical protein
MQRYSSTLSLASVLDRGSWSTLHPGQFNPSKEPRYQLYRRLGRHQSPSGRVPKSRPDWDSIPDRPACSVSLRANICNEKWLALCPPFRPGNSTR